MTFFDWIPWALAFDFALFTALVLSEWSSCECEKQQD
jgi:hypothetical protein